MMPGPTQFSIPFELMEILNRINDNVNEVKERVTRIEAQEHSNTIKILNDRIEKEKDARNHLEVEISKLKTRFAPLVIGLSMVGAAIVNYLFKG